MPSVVYTSRGRASPTADRTTLADCRGCALSWERQVFDRSNGLEKQIAPAVIREGAHPWRAFLVATRVGGRPSKRKGSRTLDVTRPILAVAGVGVSMVRFAGSIPAAVAKEP